jgi:putative intracellular protease/amidase
MSSFLLHGLGTLMAAGISAGPPSMPPRVLIVLTSHSELGKTGRKTGFYLSELTHALEVLNRAGVPADLASPKGGKPPMDGLEKKDEANRTFLESAEWTQRLERTLRLDEVDPRRYAAIYVAGGHGTMFDLPDNARLAELIQRIHAQGGVVSAVCHGPAALVNVRLEDGRYLVQGSEVAAFTNEEEAAVKLTDAMPFLLESKLVERGARFTKAAKFQPHVVTSGRLVTGQNPASARGVAEQLVKLLRTTSAAADAGMTRPSP